MHQQPGHMTAQLPSRAILILCVAIAGCQPQIGDTIHPGVYDADSQTRRGADLRLDGEDVKHIPAGSPLTVLDVDKSGEWVWVEYDGVQGWIHQNGFSNSSIFRRVCVVILATAATAWAVIHFGNVVAALWRAKLTTYFFPNHFNNFQRFVFSPDNAYWWYLTSLYFVSLVVLFQYGLLISSIDAGSMGFINATADTGAIQLFVFWAAALSFLVPLVLAYFTAHIVAGNVDAVSGTAIIHVWLVAFVFYSLVQVIVLGMLTNKRNITHVLLTSGKLAVPIVSFLFSLTRLLYEVLGDAP